MKICVQGLWHLGSVTAACLASVGHDVIGLDFDTQTIQRLSSGEAPLFEPGLNDLLKQGIEAKRLQFSSIADVAVADVDVLWVAYDTPVDDDDQADVDYVLTQIQSVLPHLPPEATVLVSSQLPVGSIKHLETLATQTYVRPDLGFASSPENLRLGKALEVFLHPDRIVVGTRQERDRIRLEKLLQPITDRIEWMSVESAEMTKHAINAFLATSVAFANEIASICELVGADAKEVERGLKSEQRIGPKAYLSPGAAFAGGTLARDIQFLGQTAAQRNLPTLLLSSVKPSNDEHKNWVRRCLQTKFPTLAGRTIAVWGLTYKPGTNTLRRSLAVELCNWLLAEGVQLEVHDPSVETLPESWPGSVIRRSTPLEVLAKADALVVATEWPQYKDIQPHHLENIKPGLVVIDANRFLQHLNVDGVDYVAVGTPQGAS